jgi:hypothetical protein
MLLLNKVQKDEWSIAGKLATKGILFYLIAFGTAIKNKVLFV